MVLAGSAFCVSDDRGDVVEGVDDIYVEDTRHLSRLVLRLDGERPELLTSALVEHFSAVVHARKEALLVRRSDGSFASTSRRFPSTLRVVPERSSCCCRC